MNILGELVVGANDRVEFLSYSLALWVLAVCFVKRLGRRRKLTVILIEHNPALAPGTEG